MQPTCSADVFDLLSAGFDAAALGVAMEVGLFHALAESPRAAADIARDLGVPVHRGRYWLALLARLGLLEHDHDTDMCRITDLASRIIVDAHEPDTWAFLAGEWRERAPVIQDLANDITEPGSVWKKHGLTRPVYFKRMMEDPQRASRFTGMLYDLHQAFAEQIADALDLTDVQRLMDLGGGSGIVSLALLRRRPGLAAVVVDIEHVRAAGRALTHARPESDRLTYHVADFLADDLPTGFDMVIECDIGVFGEDLFRKIRRSLKPGGRFVLIDQLATAPHVAPPGAMRLHWAFLNSLDDPAFSFTTIDQVQSQLAAAGFESESESTIDDGWIVIESRIGP